MIKVGLLGSVDIRDAGGNELETLVRQPKRVALLSYLAAAVPRGFHRRDTLMGLFWPESTQDQARHALSQALHVLRQEMGEDAIVTRGEGEVALSESAVSVDVWGLETALAAGDHETVVSLYQGALLNGFAVKASAEFDQWLDATRDRLARAYSDSLEQLAEAAAQRGERREAVEWWRRLVEHDPYRTHVTLGLMRALEAAGDRAAALEQAERHTELLRSEFTAEPSPDVVAYAERLRTEPVPSADEPLPQLEVSVTPSPGTTPVPVNQVAQQRWMMAGAAAVAAVIIAVIALVTSISDKGSVTLDPDRVLVSVFENQTGDASLDPLGPMAGHWINQGLQKSGVVQVVPWMEAHRASQYVASEAAAGNVRNSVMALAEETGAGTVISGAYYRRGETIQYQVEVTDVTRGQSLGVLDPAIAPLDSPDDAIEPMRQRVMGLLAISLDERLAEAGTGAIGPPTLEAYQAFDEGLRIYLTSAHDADAIPHFYRAFARDTSFALPLFYATLVHGNIGQWREADSLVGIVARSRDRLSDYDQHWLDYLRAGLDGDNRAALGAIRRAAELAPGSKAVYNRARQALHNNRPQEAVDALLTLDPERGPMRGWRPYFEQLIGAYSALDEHERALEAARQYRKTYEDNLATLRYEAAALAALGRVAQVNALLHQLIALPGEELSKGNVILGIGLDQRRLGHSEAAQATINRALRWFEAIEQETKSSVRWRWSYAWALWGADRCDEGYNVATSLAEEFPEAIEYRGLSGGLAACRGDLEEAQRVSQWLETLEGPNLMGEHTLWRSVIAGALGDGENAVVLIREAVAQGMMHPVTWTLGWIAFEPIRDYPPWQEFIRPKG